MTNQKRTELPSPAEQNLIAFRSIGYIPDGTSISYQSGSKEINDISWGLPYQHETGGWVVRVKSNKLIAVNLHDVCVPGKYTPPRLRGVMLLPDSGGDFGCWKIGKRVWAVTTWERQQGSRFWTRRWRSKRWNRNAAINLGWDLENSGYWWQIMIFEGQILDEGFEVTSRKAATISCKKLRNWLKIKRQMEGGGGA